MYCTFPVMLSNDEELLLDESLLNLFLDPREIVVSSEKCQSSSKPNLEFSIKFSVSVRKVIKEEMLMMVVIQIKKRFSLSLVLKIKISIMKQEKM